MIVKALAEGLLFGVLLVAFCAIGIRNGAVHMVFLYHMDVQERCIQKGLITQEQMRRNQLSPELLYWNVGDESETAKAFADVKML